MSLAADPVRPIACPGCAAAAPAEAPAGPARITLAVPGIHCAGCISGVERALTAQAGVRAARVNLTLRRVGIDAAPTLTPEALIGVLAAAGYEAHPLTAEQTAATEVDAKGRDLLMRLAVAAFAMMNVMLLSVAVWSGAEGATRDLFHWISAAIALPAIAFCGKPFFVSAWEALRARRLNMDVPIALAVTLAAATSLIETSLGGHHAYFDASVMLIAFLLTGRYLDHRTRASARSAAAELASLEVTEATRIADGAERAVPVADLAPGDLVRVRPGGRMPVDGVVADGASEVDRGLMTGESLPAAVAPGDPVAAGEINLTGALTVRVTATGADTRLRRIADLVAVAEAGRANYAPLADRAATLYAPGVHVLAGLAAVGWWLGTGDIRVALNIAAAVLIITCPCALALAVPAVTTAASGRLFRDGFLVKDATALERLAEVDTVVFDKTGTLTLGTPVPAGLDALPKEAVAVAVALARGSSHPLAQALAALPLPPSEVEGLREVPGCGVEGVWKGACVRLGRAAWVGAEALDRTATYLSLGGATYAIPFEDSLRPGAETAVAALIRQGYDVRLISGDAPAAVAATARRLGIDAATAGALPQEKVAAVEALAARGARVLMVGDGLNDTAALAAAHVAISPASGLDAARAAADIVLTGRDLAALPHAIATARSARRRISENFTLATLYNVIAVPLAVAGLATPLIAAAAMSLSSVTVSLNAMRLR